MRHIALPLVAVLISACAAQETAPVRETVPAPPATVVQPVEVQASPSRPLLPTATGQPAALPTAEPSPLATPTAVLPPTPAVAPTPTEAIVLVEVGEYFVTPPSLTIRVGTTVEWVPVGDREHTIVSLNGTPGWPRDGSVGSAGGAHFRATFREPGVYAYFCSIHPGVMDGEVVVLAAGAGEAP